MTWVGGRALGGAAALAAAVGVWAGPGAAPAAAYVCSFGIDSPTSAAPSGTPSVSFSGPFAVKQGQGDRVLDINFTGSPGPLPPAVRRTGGEVGPGARYDVGVGGLTLNGQYTAQVRASHAGTGLFNCDDGLGDVRRDGTRSGTVTFSVSVRARPPANVRARFEAGPPRSAVVTWDRSPDPDTAGYELTRRVGSGPVETMPPVPPATTSWTDDVPPADAATVTYAVRSARNGPTRDTTSERSDYVTATLAVPAPPPPPPPPPTTTPSPPGSQGPGPGGPAAPGATPPPATPGRNPAAPGVPVFKLGQAVPGSSAPGGATPVLSFPDGLTAAVPGSDDEEGSYDPLLPYPSTPEGGQVQLPTEDGEAAFGGPAGGGDERTPQLAYVAGALLSAVVAAHVLWLRGEVLRPDDGELLPVAPPPAPSPDHVFESPPAPGPPPEPRPAVSSRPILIGRPEAGSP